MWYMVIGGLIGAGLIVTAYAIGVIVTESKIRSAK
jgi:hypothetical protein